MRATDIDETIRFWRDGLGLRLVQDRGQSFDLTDGYHNFRIFQHNGPSRPEHVSGMLDYLHIGIRVPDLEAAGAAFDGYGLRDFFRWSGR